jgi:hypothetical protein
LLDVDAGQLSWTQAEPIMSLRLVEQLPIKHEDASVGNLRR